MYIILTDKGLFQVPTLTPEDLALCGGGGIQILRIQRGEPEYLMEVVSRSIDEPTNSLDETRFDQAVDGRIYEAGAWQALPLLPREPAAPDRNRNPITLYADEEARRSLVNNETEDVRRQRLIEAGKE